MTAIRVYTASGGWQDIALVGPTGPQGVQGAQGVQGPQGVAGPAQAYSQNIGDGTSTVFTVTHNKNTRAVVVALFRNSAPYDEVICDVEHTDLNTVTLRTPIAPPPTTNQYTAVVFG